ncbi:YodC family protein [Azospirillum palustre]
MANAFQKGDVVVLKSGGPPMTVDKVPGEPSHMPNTPRKEYACEWFKGAAPARGSYGEHVLKLYEPPAKK